MARVTGPWAGNDRWSFRLVVDYEYTSSAITFIGRVEIYNGDKGTASTVTVNYDGGSYNVTAPAHSDGLYGSSTWRSIPKYTTTIKATASVGTSKVTLTSNLKPCTPSIALTFVNNNRTKVNIKGGSKGILTQTVTLQRQDEISSAQWSELTVFSPNNVDYNLNFDDQTTERGHRYRYRAWASNSSGSSSSTYSNWLYTYPPDISNVAHIRDSNYKNTVSWQRSGQDVDRSLITGFVVERSQSGGAWTKIADVGAGDPLAQTVYYEDKTCSPDNSYSYRVKPKNPRGTSIIAFDEGGTDRTYNTPSAPSSIQAAYTTAAGSVRLELVNTTKTATELVIERSLNGGSTWDELVTLDETTGPITTYTDSSGVSGDAVQYRARNGRTDLDISEQYSAWTYSNTVMALSQPNAPTLILPVNGTPVSLDSQTVRLLWTHNPTDGTAQSAAQIQYRINGDYVATITLTTESVYDLNIDPSRFSANDVVTWRVRTKGSYSEYSEWSEYNDFTTLGLPEIEWTAPQNGTVIDNLPLELGWTYNDTSGVLTSLTLKIVHGDRTKRTIDIPVGTGESGSYTYTLSDFLFDNGESYQLQVMALSSSGLSVADTIDVDIDYEYVRFSNALFADAVFDSNTGEVMLSVLPNEAPTEGEEGVVDADVVKAYLYRNVNGDRTLIGDGIQEGDQVIDKYAPLNVPVIYEILEIADNGMLSLVTMEFTFKSLYWYVYWNDRVVRAIWEPNGNAALSRPEREQIRYSGRKYPVSYDSKAIEETYSFSGITDDRETLDAFAEMIRDGGQGVWKSADGQCYKADFEYSYAANYTYHHIRWDISLDVTRIDSEDL